LKKNNGPSGHRMMSFETEHGLVTIHFDDKSLMITSSKQVMNIELFQAFIGYMERINAVPAQ
tara:strand:+ start:1029 stop:1214 length:186 start_codon:yes stop_codon:yes gene_type:complete